MFHVGIFREIEMWVILINGVLSHHFLIEFISIVGTCHLKFLTASLCENDEKELIDFRDEWILIL